MTSAKFDRYKELSKVTDETTENEIKKIYDNWALNYDQDVNSHGYVVHKTCTDIFDAEMKKAFPGQDRLSLPIMDAGAGTGIVGKHLHDLGYTNVDGIDISPAMLKIAREKDIYKKLICAPISEKKVDEITDGYYDGIVCSGTITVAHLKAQSLGEVQRWLKPGGIFCFTIRQDTLETEEYGYQQKIDELKEAGKWKLVHKNLAIHHTTADKAVLAKRDYCYILALQGL